MAMNVRREILSSAYPHGSFVGASLSCADILLCLFQKVIRRSDSEIIEKFFLSKGHDVPALYAILSHMGLLRSDWLAHHCEGTDDIYWHPNPSIAGIQAYSGSLGHNLSLAIGNSISEKLRNSENRTFVMVGDGELNEGSNWEALQIASHQKLSDLYILVDRNKFQANGEVEKISGMSNLEAKFRAFGCVVVTCDGHDFDEILQSFEKLRAETLKPKVIIFETIRGKGVPSLEARADKWFVQLTKDQLSILQTELETGKIITNNIEGQVVR